MCIRDRLYASCLEAIGIHPLIIVVKGHAFAGGWLVPETSPDSVIEDISLINKRIADGINDITLVETTCMNMGPVSYTHLDVYKRQRQKV